MTARQRLTDAIELLTMLELWQEQETEASETVNRPVLEELVSQLTDRLNAALDGIRGDITSLKDAVLDERALLESALADQSQKVQTAVHQAVTEAQAATDEQLEALVSKAEALDAENPPASPDEELPVEPIAGGDVTPVPLSPVPPTEEEVAEEESESSEESTTPTEGEQPIEEPLPTEGETVEVSEPVPAEEEGR